MSSNDLRGTNQPWGIAGKDNPDKGLRGMERNTAKGVSAPVVISGETAIVYGKGSSSEGPEFMTANS